MDLVTASFYQPLIFYSLKHIVTCVALMEIEVNIEGISPLSMVRVLCMRMYMCTFACRAQTLVLHTDNKISWEFHAIGLSYDI